MPIRPPKSPLASCHRRFVQQSPQQHGVEIGGEVDRDSCTRGPGQVRDVLVPCVVASGSRAEIGDGLGKLGGHCPGVPLQRPVLTSRAFQSSWGRQAHAQTSLIDFAHTGAAEFGACGNPPSRRHCSRL
jgi:hypothetical protein